MVLQFKLKTSSRWQDYPGKSKMKVPLARCDFRLLTSDRRRVIVEKGSYDAVMKRFRQIEFFKHKG